MDRLSDSVLTLLVNRCCLTDRLSRRLHDRSSLLRTYIGLIRTSSTQFTDRYIGLTTLDILSPSYYYNILMRSVESLSHTTRSRITRLIGITSSDNLVELFPSLQPTSNRPLRSTYEWDGKGQAPEDITRANLSFPPGHNVFSHSSVRSINLTQHWTSNTRLNCPKLKYLYILHGGECDVSSCSSLSVLHQRSCTISSYPKSLTVLHVHKMKLCDAYNTDLPLLKELQIDELEKTNTDLVHVGRFPRSLTHLCLYSSPNVLILAGDSNLTSLTTGCDIESLPSSLVRLESGLSPGEAIRQCTRLRELTCTYSESSVVIWPSSLTKILIHVRSEEPIAWPSTLPPYLRVLTMDAAYYIRVKIPTEWRFNTLTKLDVRSNLTPDQINSINCIEFVVDNKTASWKHDLSGSQRIRSGYSENN